jgi:hypothetical protein
VDELVTLVTFGIEEVDVVVVDWLCVVMPDRRANSINPSRCSSIALVFSSILLTLKQGRSGCYFMYFPLRWISSVWNT